MRIVYCIQDLNVRGGTHKQLLKLIQYTDKQGIDFIVLTKVLDLHNTYPEFSTYSEKIFVCKYEIHRPFIFKIKGLRKFATPYSEYLYKKNFRRYIHKCDVINIHDNGWEEDLPLMEGKRVVWQVNDLPGCFGFGASKHHITQEDLMFQQRSREAMKYIDSITVNVSKNAQRVKQAYNRSAQVFYCGVEPVGVIRDINDTFARFANRRINILSSGVFFPYRNYETQVMVVKQLVDNGYDVKLRIIGELRNIEYARKIQHMIVEYGLGDIITIEGQVDEDRYKELHRQSDIFLFINVDQSWGLAVFEAMSCALPVIVSESVGATEILKNGENSIFVNPLDSDSIEKQIIRLIQNREYYSLISENASKFHLSWSWDDAYCSKMIKLFAEIEA